MIEGGREMLDRGRKMLKGGREVTKFKKKGLLTSLGVSDDPVDPVDGLGATSSRDPRFRGGWTSPPTISQSSSCWPFREEAVALSALTS